MMQFQVEYIDTPGTIHTAHDIFGITLLNMLHIRNRLTQVNNQSKLVKVRSRDWLSTNQGPVFPYSVGSCYTFSATIKELEVCLNVHVAISLSMRQSDYWMPPSNDNSSQYKLEVTEVCMICYLVGRRLDTK
eukprot:sb/3474954/